MSRLYSRTEAGRRAWDAQSARVPLDYRRVLGLVVQDTDPQAIGAKLGCDEAGLTLKSGQIITQSRQIPLSEILGRPLSAEGHIEPGETADAVHQAAYGAHFAEVAVSQVTGETRIRRMLGVFSAGRILNTKTARSQCIGGMIFGIGIALTEALEHDARDGHIVNHDFAEYHLPVNLDVIHGGPPVRKTRHEVEYPDGWVLRLSA